MHLSLGEAGGRNRARPGTHLFDHLKAEKRFTEDRVQWYASEIAGALEWLHSKGWLYRVAWEQW